MNFTSSIFLFFYFPVSIAGYLFIRLLCGKKKTLENIISNLFLIVCSLFFYGWMIPELVLNFIFYMFIIYVLGQWIGYERTKSKASKKFLSIGIVIVTAILIYYKYYNFLLEEVVKKESGQLQNIVVPLGISFITFSAISYLVDVYRENAPKGSLLDVMLYLCFFPKVISGPIVLWKDFASEIRNRTIEESAFLNGLNRMMIGFVKKVILADTFGLLIAQIQEQISGRGITALTAWGCAVLYMLQIYYDFAGYSDIAIGIAQMFGFKFKENFQFPYVSKSITEFWRRWHISLGTWFREYIYIPLGGNRKGKARTLVNLGIVFLLTGIWHGAGWNYIWWGILNGACVIVERCVRDTTLYQKIPAIIKWAVTMTIVLFSWELFRFPTMEEFELFMDIMFGKLVFEEITYSAAYFFTGKTVVYMLIAGVGAVLPMLMKEHRIGSMKDKLNTTKAGVIVQEIVLVIIMVIAVICMVNSSYSPFIYFQY